MTGIKESLFIRALQKKNTERTPVWIMRQAGRYLPEYRQVRAQAGDFLSLCKNPELACEVTLQPLRRFELDAAILFSDILTIPDAMGLGLYFVEGEGPCFKTPVRDAKAIDALNVPESKKDLAYVMDAASLIRSKMPKELPLIGFSGSPWTLACYMVEGRSSRDFKNIRHLLYTQPQTLHHLLDKLEQAVFDYLDEQVNAGVNALMLFDTWGGILTPTSYQQFSLDYMSKIVRKLKEKHPQIPITLFTKGGGLWLEAMTSSGCDALGLDWTIDIGVARKKVGERVALQGNLDPAILLSNKACIEEQVQKVLESYGHGSGHIFNLGHGITPDVPPENLGYLIEAVKKHSPQYHLA